MRTAPTARCLFAHGNDELRPAAAAAAAAAAAGGGGAGGAAGGADGGGAKGDGVRKWGAGEGAREGSAVRAHYSELN